MSENFLSKLTGFEDDQFENFFLIAGPCAVESENLTLQIAKEIKAICQELSIPFIFKASYKKANRSKLDSFSGIGDEKALKILSKVKDQLDVPITTDIHSAEEAVLAAEHVDVLQIPAFLCRQTELLQAAAKTGKIVNVKKGQFLNAHSMKFAADKIAATGNHNILLTERGSFFGYQDLVVDFRNIKIMDSFGYPVVYDATHSLQMPNQSSGVTSGKPELISHMSKVAIASGVKGLFIETHPDPSQALSDGANMLPLSLLKNLLENLVKIYQVTKAID